MVSLERRSSRAGGFSFDSQNMDSEEDQLFQDPTVQFVNPGSPRKKPLRTYVISIFLIIVTIILEVFSILILGCEIWGRKSVNILDERVQVESLVIYMHTAYWACNALLYLVIKRMHTSVRLQGYLQFDKKTLNLRKAPHYVVLSAKVALLLSVAVFQDVCSRKDPNPFLCGSKARTTVIRWFLLGIVSVEVLLNIILLIIYTVQVIRFNRSTTPPDAMDEHYLTSSLNGPLDFTCREESRAEEVIEKQAELIHYLREHNAILSRRLLNIPSTSHE